MMKKIPFLLIIGGVCMLLYGAYQIWYTNSQQDKALAEANHIIEDKNVSSQKNHEKPIDPTTLELHVGDAIGVLTIPALDRKLPIIHGVDEDELAQGVGHYPGTVLPDQNDQILLSGHRDTVFRQLGELAIGDELIVDMPYGQFVYEIQNTEIVDADDRTVIRSTAPDEVLTLSTCYPFRFIGNAPERYIINAKRQTQ